MSGALEARVVELEAALKTAELNVAMLTEQRSVISGKYTEWMERATASEARSTALEREVQSLLAGGQRDAESIEGWRIRATALLELVREAMNYWDGDINLAGWFRRARALAAQQDRQTEASNDA
jgi:hypothetical protein